MRDHAPATTPTIHTELLDRLRSTSPLVQSITNTVVTNFTANALLALGAAPAMVDIPGEAGMFAGLAGGVLINLGTPLAENRAAAVEAAAAAGRAGTPWVLDPVAAGVLPIRTALAAELVAAGPTVIRGNASEILAAAGAGGGGRGVDSTAGPEAALDAARGLAVRTGGVVAVSGPTDLVTDGSTVVRVANGDRLLTRITGGGCALGAVMAAFLAVSEETTVFDATVTAVACYTIAAELAAEQAAGPGSFAVAFLDRLGDLTADQVRQRVVLA